MRFRPTSAPDDVDVVIDLRERLAPYGDPPDGRDLEPATAPASPRGRPLRAAPYEPRHLAT